MSMMCLSASVFVQTFSCYPLMEPHGTPCSILSWRIFQLIPRIRCPFHRRESPGVGLGSTPGMEFSSRAIICNGTSCTDMSRKRKSKTTRVSFLCRLSCSDNLVESATTRWMNFRRSKIEATSASVRGGDIGRVLSYRFFFQRAAAAFLAILFRLAGLNLSARALPPFRPPFRPMAAR